MKSIKHIEGIGQAYMGTLKEAGIGSVEKLLEKGGHRTGRQSVAERTGISEGLLLKWVNMADLFRIRGVASQYAELLECAGVDTVKELAQRNAASLHAKMTETNATKRVVRQVPALKNVERWVAEARTLPQQVTH